MRTIPDISELLKLLDDAINNFVKSLFNNYSFNETERFLLSLPPKFGGMGIISNEEYHNSRLITADTINNIMHGTKIYKQNIHITKVKSQMKTNKNKKHDNLLTHIKNHTVQDKLKALEASRENGASILARSMPIKEYGFALDKKSFWDCICLRYHTLTAKIFGEQMFSDKQSFWDCICLRLYHTLTAKIFGEQMFSGLSNHRKFRLIISVKMDFETFHRNRHLVDRNICSHTISMF